MSITAMKQALEALEGSRVLKADYLTLEGYGHAQYLHNAAITALRQAIAQAERIENPPIRIQNHAHTDHPMRHWDRTCPACVSEEKNWVPREVVYKNSVYQTPDGFTNIQNKICDQQTEKQEQNRCQTCGGALPITGRNDRTGECDCEVVSSIFWFSAPTKTEWGQDMVCANIQIDKDHTLTMYCEQSQIHKVPNVIEVKLIRGRTE